VYSRVGRARTDRLILLLYAYGLVVEEDEDLRVKRRRSKEGLLPLAVGQSTSMHEELEDDDTVFDIM